MNDVSCIIEKPEQTFKITEHRFNPQNNSIDYFFVNPITEAGKWESDLYQTQEGKAIIRKYWKDINNENDMEIGEKNEIIGSYKSPFTKSVFYATKDENGHHFIPGDSLSLVTRREEVFDYYFNLLNID